MKMIVAADWEWGIGKEGNLLVHIPADMEFFKSKTIGNVVVMGRKTFEGFPGKKALPGRTNIVLTTNPDWKAEDALVVHSLEELDELLKQYDSDSLYIIGGGQVYREYLDRCDTIYVTHIEAVFNADTWFPNLEADERFEKEETLLEGEWNRIPFSICVWGRKS